jgi:hypothetical protein
MRLWPTPTDNSRARVAAGGLGRDRATRVVLVSELPVEGAARLVPAPSEFMRARRPELFSDGIDRDELILDKARLEFHLDSTTARSESYPVAKAVSDRWARPAPLVRQERLQPGRPGEIARHAMRLGLARGPVAPEDIIYFSPQPPARRRAPGVVAAKSPRAEAVVA